MTDVENLTLDHDEDEDSAVSFKFQHETCKDLDATISFVHEKNDIKLSISIKDASLCGLVVNARSLDSNLSEIDVSTLNPIALPFIVRFLEYHKGVSPMPIDKLEPGDDLTFESYFEDAWDANLMNELHRDFKGDSPKKMSKLFDAVLQATFFLEIRSLFNYMTFKIAYVCKHVQFGNCELICQAYDGPEATPDVPFQCSYDSDDNMFESKEEKQD